MWRRERQDGDTVVAEDLPPSLRGPQQLALARAADVVPTSAALPGGSLYEPKWDGYRVTVTRTAADVTVWSRRGADITPIVPDLYPALLDSLPAGCVVDGELVVWSGNRLDFEALQRRMNSSRRGLAQLVRSQPASFVAFDMLAVAGRGIRHRPLRDRRALLAELARSWSPPLEISPQTSDRQEALRWLDELHLAGVEGIFAKGAAQPYRGDRRDWVKVKYRRTLDVVCGAVTGTLQQPGQLIAGMPIDGELRVVGRTGQLRPATARQLTPLLRPPAGQHPWPAVLPPSTLEHFSRSKEPVRVTLVDPLVVEVSADTAWSGRAFRHTLRFLRARPDLRPADVVPPE